MAKTVIFLFHADDESLNQGPTAAGRVRQSAPDAGVELEVFCLGPAQAALADGSENPIHVAFREQVNQLIAMGVTVGASVDDARSNGTESELRALGLNLEDASDAFIRFALDGASVISF